MRERLRFGRSARTTFGWQDATMPSTTAHTTFSASPATTQLSLWSFPSSSWYRVAWGPPTTIGTPSACTSSMILSASFIVAVYSVTPTTSGLKLSTKCLGGGAPCLN